MTQDSYVGKSLPKLRLPSSSGKEVTLPDGLKGSWTLLYFYPKDDTPGCTKQACGYRDQMQEFESNDIQVFGVSGDSLSSHEKFIKKYNLNFPLLSDSEGKLREALGVSSRDSFLIDPQGKVKQVWRKVKPDTTVAETLAAAQESID